MAEFKPGMETPKPQVPRMPENQVPPTEAPKTEKATRVEGRIEHMVKFTKQYLADMRMAYENAAWSLGGQTVTGKILEGATVTAVGAGLETITESLYSTVFGPVIGAIQDKLGRKMDKTPGNERAKPAAAPISVVMTGELDPLVIDKIRHQMAGVPLGDKLPDWIQRINIQPDKRENRIVNPATGDIFTDDYKNVLRETIEKLLGVPKTKDGKAIPGFRSFVANGLLNGLNDMVVVGSYGLINSFTGHMMPYVPTEYMGKSLVFDMAGAAAGTAGEKIGQAIGPVTPGSFREKAGNKLGKIGAILNLANPVSLFGLDLMKSGWDAYRLAFKDVRAAREATQQGGRNVMYVAEGRPNYQKPWQRNRPWQRGGRRYG